jgi:hypothetical protein
MQRALNLILFSFILAVSGAYGQTFRGAINGTVTDPSGAAVAGATVTATDTATNIAHNTVATTEGQFAFQDLPPGTYSVTVTAAGFQKTTVSNVIVSAGNIYTMPVTLAVGQQSTVVEVAAAAVAIDTTTSTQERYASKHFDTKPPLERTGFHPDDRGGARLRRLLSGGLWIAQRNAPQSNELAD